ncbi:hypothetical protein D9M72_361340 [compost metagenome]
MRGRLQQLRQDRHGRIRVVPLQGHHAAQHGQRDARLGIVGRDIGLQAIHGGRGRIELAGVELHAQLPEPQADARLDLLGRQQPHQLHHPAQFAPAEQVPGALQHQVGSRVGFAAKHGVAHGLFDVAMRAEPMPGGYVDLSLLDLAPGMEAFEQGLAQQGMEPVPRTGFGALDRHDK